MKDYIEFKTKISKSGGTSSSAKTTVPKEILQKMEVTVGDYITWRVYDGNKVITILNQEKPPEKSTTKNKKKQKTQKHKNTSVNIDETTQKPTKKETKKIHKVIPTKNKEFSIELLENPYLQIRIINNNTQKQVTTLGASKREETEIQTIISQLKEGNSKEEYIEILNQYRPPK